MINRVFNPSNVRNREKTDLVLPAGDYKVKCVGSYDTVSGKTGLDMIKLVWEVQGGEFGGYRVNSFLTDDESFDQRVDNIYQSADKETPAQLNSHTFRDLVAYVHTKQGEYNGKTVADVSYFIPFNVVPESLRPAAVPDDIPF